MGDLIKHQQKPFEVAVERARPNFLEICKDPKTFSRESNFALQHIRGNSALMEIAKNTAGFESIRTSVENVALTGLTLNPTLGYAYLVPRKNKCCLDISYKGLIKIATEENTNISSISAMVVYTWDKLFEYEEGSKPFVRHVPNFNPKVDDVDIEAILKSPVKIWDYVECAYSRAILRDGSVDIVVLPLWRLKKIYNTSKDKDSKYSPWKNWPEEQIRKTVIKYHSKTLQGTGTGRLQEAVTILNEHEGLDKDPFDETTNANRLNEKLPSQQTPDPSGEDNVIDTTVEEVDEPESQKDNSLANTIIKSLQNCQNMEEWASVSNTAQENKSKFTADEWKAITKAKGDVRASFNKGGETKPKEDKKGAASEKLDEPEKCRPCKEVKTCMNKKLEAGRDNCTGPYLI